DALGCLPHQLVGIRSAALLAGELQPAGEVRSVGRLRHDRARLTLSSRGSKRGSPPPAPHVSRASGRKCRITLHLCAACRRGHRAGPSGDADRVGPRDADAPLSRPRPEPAPGVWRVIRGRVWLAPRHSSAIGGRPLLLANRECCQQDAVTSIYPPVAQPARGRGAARALGLLIGVCVPVGVLLYLGAQRFIESRKHSLVASRFRVLDGFAAQLADTAQAAREAFARTGERSGHASYFTALTGESHVIAVY